MGKDYLLNRNGTFYFRYNGIDYIEVSREDIYQETELASELLGISLDDLSLPARNLLQLLLEMPKVFTREDVMAHPGWTKTPPSHPLDRTNRNGAGLPRINEEEPAPNLQNPLERRRPRQKEAHARFAWYSIGVHQ